MSSKLKFEAPQTHEAHVFDKDQALETLRRYCERRYSPASCKGIMQGTRYLIEKYGVRVPGPGDDEKIVEAMKREGISNRTINHKLYYLEYLAAALGVTVDGLPLKYEKLPVIRKKQKALSVVEAAGLLEMAKARSYRDYAIIATFIMAGLRATELVNLDLSDIDFNNGYLWVLDKGAGVKSGREENVIITPQLREILREWLKVRPAVDIPALFMSVNGRRFSRDTMHYLVSKIGREAGLEGVYPHKLRRTCGSSIIKLGGNVLDAQRQLRHKQLSTTVDIYLSGDEDGHRANLNKLKY